MNSSEHYSLQQVKKGAIHFLFGKTFTALTGLITALIFVRQLDPPAYAGYSVMLGLSLLIGSLTSFLSEITGQRFIPELIVQKKKALLNSVVRLIIRFRFFCLIGALSLFVPITPWLAGAFSMPLFVNELKLWAFGIFFIVFYQFSSLLLEIFMMQKASKWIGIATSQLRLTLAALFLFNQKSLQLFHVVLVEIFSNGFGCICSLIGIFLFLKKNAGAREAGTGKKEELFKRIYNFSLYNYFRNIILILSGEATNRLMVAKYLSPAQIATFGFSQSLASMAMRYMPSFFLRNLIRPAMMANFSRDSSSANLNIQANFVFKLNCLVLLPVLFWLVLLGDQIGSLLSAGKYPHSGGVLIALFGLLLIQDHYSIFEAHLYAREENRTLFYASLILIFFLLPALYLIQRYGVAGLLAARFFGVIARNSAVSVFLAKKGIKKCTDWNGLLRIFISAAIPTALLLPLRPANVTTGVFCFFTVISSLVYLISLVLMKPFTPWEKGIFNRMANRTIFSCG